MPHPWMRRKRYAKPKLLPLVADLRRTDKGSIDRRRWGRRRRHVQDRALERFHLALSYDDVALLEIGIGVGCSMMLAINSTRGTELHEIVWHGKNIYAVYDVRHRYIRTILTKAYAQTSFSI